MRRQGTRVAIALGAIVTVGLLIRLIHFAAIVRTPFPGFARDFAEADMRAFLEWSQAILAGDWLGRETYHPYFPWMRAMAPIETWYRWWGGRAIFHQEPFYPYFLALVMRLGGSSLSRPLLVQLLIGSLQPVVVFLLIRRLLDARAGLIAAAATAVYAPFVFHQATLLRDWLPPLVEPLMLWLVLRAAAGGRARDGVLAGAAIGLAVLIRSTALVFLPLAGLGLVWIHRREVRRAASSVGALGLGLGIALAPLVARNLAVGAPPFAVCNRALEGFIEGNAAGVDPIGMEWPASMPGILEAASGRLSGVVAGTLRTWNGRFGDVARNQVRKLRGVLDPLEVPNNLSFYYATEISPVLRYGLSFGWIVAPGVAGLCLGLRPRRRSDHLLTLLYLAATLGGLMAGNILGRYRLSLAQALIGFLPVPLLAVLDGIRARRWPRAIGVAGAVVLLAVGQHRLVAIRDLREKGAMMVHGPEYLLAIEAYARDQRYADAEREIERLRRRAAGFPSAASSIASMEGRVQAAWAESLVSRGQPDEARRHARLGIEAYLAHPKRHEVRPFLARLHLLIGDAAAARSELERFLEEEPDGPLAERVRKLLGGLDGA